MTRPTSARQAVWVGAAADGLGEPAQRRDHPFDDERTKTIFGGANVLNAKPTRTVVVQTCNSY
jgi:hypothetical protein